LYFEDLYIFLPFLLNFFLIWVIFFKLNFFLVKSKYLYSDSIGKTSSFYTVNNAFFLNVNKLLLLLLLFYFYLFKGTNNTI
jgi:hypothetical protein